ncbi:hypothetical protein J6590_079465 [Homalodisca vitripennis]|nr:hypothetical protein J6590_079465 [Homalodisca vitripennis]
MYCIAEIDHQQSTEVETLVEEANRKLDDEDKGLTSSARRKSLTFSPGFDPKRPPTWKRSDHLLVNVSQSRLLNHGLFNRVCSFETSLFLDIRASIFRSGMTSMVFEEGFHGLQLTHLVHNIKIGLVTTVVTIDVSKAFEYVSPSWRLCIFQLLASHIFDRRFAVSMRPTIANLRPDYALYFLESPPLSFLELKLLLVQSLPTLDLNACLVPYNICFIQESNTAILRSTGLRSVYKYIKDQALVIVGQYEGLNFSRGYPAQEIAETKGTVGQQGLGNITTRTSLNQRLSHPIILLTELISRSKYSGSYSSSPTVLH